MASSLLGAGRRRAKRRVQHDARDDSGDDAPKRRADPEEARMFTSE